MTQNSRDQLLKLIEELQLPMTPEEAKEHLEHLNDEEVELLLWKYKSAKEFEASVDEAAEKKDPEAFAKLKAKQDQEMLDLKLDHLDQKEQLQKKADEELDKIDHQEELQYKDLLYKQQLEFHEIEDEYKDLYSQLTSALTKQNKTDAPPSSTPAVASDGKKSGPTIY